MPDYKEMYLKLIRAQVHAIRLLEIAHREAEEMYIESKDPICFLPEDETEEHEQ